MGLLLGGSVLTVCELIDLMIFNFFKKLMRRRDAEEKLRQREAERRRKEAAQSVKVCDHGPILILVVQWSEG